MERTATTGRSAAATCKKSFTQYNVSIYTDAAEPSLTQGLQLYSTTLMWGMPLTVPSKGLNCWDLNSLQSLPL